MLKVYHGPSVKLCMYYVHMYIISDFGLAKYEYGFWVRCFGGGEKIQTCRSLQASFKTSQNLYSGGFQKVP